jgi:hypothetical protein
LLVCASGESSGGPKLPPRTCIPNRWPRRTYRLISLKQYHTTTHWVELDSWVDIGYKHRARQDERDIPMNAIRNGDDACNLIQYAPSVISSTSPLSPKHWANLQPPG